MLPKLDDETLGAYVDMELEPAEVLEVEAAAQSSAEIRQRLEAIRRANAAVQAVYRARRTFKRAPPH